MEAVKTGVLLDELVCNAGLSVVVNSDSLVLLAGGHHVGAAMFLVHP